MKGTNWCKVGDTIRCKKPLQCWPNEGRVLTCTVSTPEAAAYGNQLIADGTWEVCQRLGDSEENEVGGET